MSISKSFFLLVFSFLFLSCATYRSEVRPGLEMASNSQWDGAIDHFKKLSDNEKSKDRLAYLLELATVLQASGRYRESSEVFKKANQLSEELDYLSLSKVGLATLGGEEMVQYKGESFEKIMINAMNALNFLSLGEKDSAFVEIRKIDEKVVRFRRENREDYELNFFGLYLSGLLYESIQSWDDAYISYERAYLVYPQSYFLPYDLTRVATKAKRELNLSKLGLKKTESQDLYSNPLCKKIKCGEFVFIFLQGLGAQKIPDPLQPRYPLLVESKNLIQSIQIQFNEDLKRSTQKKKLVTHSLYNVSEAAIHTLNADRASLIARRFGSFVAKEVVAEQIRQKDEALGLISLLIMHLSDRADLRQWSSLPHSVQMIRYQLPPGEWVFQPTGLDSSGNQVKNYEPLKLKIYPGQMSFKVLRDFNQ